MTIRHHQSINWHLCLLSLAITAIAASSILVPASAFSSRPNKRTYSKRRSASGGNEHFASTRRVFCFTFAGGAHNMFSGMRTHSSGGHASTHRRSGPTSSSSSTKLNYRAMEDDWEYCCSVSDGDSSSYTDSLWHAALSTSSIRHDTPYVSASSSLLTTPKQIIKPVSKGGSNGGLLETAKAFIPVAVEIGVVAAAAANVQQSLN